MNKEDLVYVYKFQHKKSKKMPFSATWMQLEIITLSEVSQKEKDKYCILSLVCGIQNMTEMNLSMEQKQESGAQITDGGCQEGGGWEKVGVGGWGWQMQTAKCTIDWRNNKVLPYCTGNNIQYPVVSHHGKEYEKECKKMFLN